MIITFDVNTIIVDVDIDVIIDVDVNIDVYTDVDVNTAIVVSVVIYFSDVFKTKGWVSPWKSFKRP